MQRVKDKYGRGSAALNGAEFVDLEPGDTFSGLEAKLRLLQSVIYENRLLGLRASIASRRNANELSKHMAPGEEEEAHKFAAKNVGALFARGVVGIRHFDKKAIRDDVPKPVMLRIFSAFVFADKRMIATITLRQERDGNRLYAIEALEINKDTDSERTPRGGTAPLQNQVSQLKSRIAYYVGDVNRTKPAFLGRPEPFGIEAAAELIAWTVAATFGKDAGKELSDLLTVVIPVKNEEKNLSACLKNVEDFKHVVLVDSGSTDRTREIFDGFRFQVSGEGEKVSGSRFQGWEIVDFKWDGKFPKKRNWVLRNYGFKTPWVMFLDADERMTDAWKREAEKLLAEAAREDMSSTGERVDAWICSYDNWFMGRMLRHGDVMQKTAILRVGKGEYEKIDEDNWSSLDMEIHEHLQVEGKIGTIRAHLEHHDKRSFESHVAKHREYAKWEANRYRQLMNHPERWDALSPRQKVKYRNLTKWWLAPAYFVVCYFRKLGFLDGSAGLRFALFKAWYFSLIRKQLHEMVGPEVDGTVGK